MKQSLRTIRDMLLFILLAPQFFVFSYYFSYFFKGANKLALAQRLFVLALTVSWISAPLLLALAFAVKAMLARRWRWHTVLPLSAAAGFLWLALWNLTVYNNFSYVRSALPLLLCSTITAGFALASRMYEDTAPKNKDSENSASDLPE